MEWEITFVHEAGSSMEAVLRLPPSAKEGTVVVVEKQLSGRGRQGRSWISPLGGLYFSIILRPMWSLSDVSKITLLAAVALCEAVRDAAGIPAEIKWPNDLLMNGKKIAGILTESKISGQTVEHVVLGIGVNLNTSISDLPEGATSLKQLTGREYDVKKMLNCILERLAFWYQQVQNEGFGQMLDRWRQYCGMLGQRVQILQVKGESEGVALDITEAGGLLIENDDGSRVELMSGQIVRARQY